MPFLEYCKHVILGTLGTHKQTQKLCQFKTLLEVHLHQKRKKEKKNKKIQETNPEKLQILILCTLHCALCPTYYVQQHQPKKTLSLCRGH